MLKRQEFWALNWLRFVLSIYLVLFHTLNMRYGIDESHPVISALLDLGNLATSIFFVASGFLLTYVYIELRGGRAIDKGTFLVSRIAAVYPLHLLTMLLALPVFFDVVYRHGGMLVAAQVFGEQTRMLSHGEVVLLFLTNLTLTHAWNPLFLILNPPSWSLSCLLFFYILFPYIAPRLNKVHRPWVGLVVTAILFAIPGVCSQLMGWDSLVIDGVLHRNPILRLPLFVGGIFLCTICSRHNDGERSGRVSFNVVMSIVVIATIAVAAYFQAQNPEHRLHAIRNGLYFPAAVAIVWMCAKAGPGLSGWNTQWSARLGKASLSIFALHSPMFEIFTRAERILHAWINSTDGFESFSAMFMEAKAVEPSLAVYPVYLFMVIFASIALQEKIVNPLQILIKKRYFLWKTRKAQTDSSVATALAAFQNAKQ